MDTAERPEKDRQGTMSEKLETANAVAGMFEKDEPVRCSCHGEEKKSQKLSLAAAVFSFVALALSVASLALPFFKKSDDVTFDADAWREFLTTLEERFDAEETDPAPAAMVPAPVRPRPAVTTTAVPTPTPAPAGTTQEETPAGTPAETVPAETPAEQAPAGGTAAGTAEEPVAAGTRQ